MILVVLLLLIVVPFLPLMGAIYAGVKIHNSTKALSAPSNIVRLLLLIICLLPYAYDYGSQLYRNSLCAIEGVSDLRFDPEEWARQNPLDATAIGPASEPGRKQTKPNIYIEQINSRFAVIEQYRDRGFSVSERHLSLIDQKAGKIVVEVKEFYVPSGSGKSIIDFSIPRPRVCNSWSQYEELFNSLRRMGYGK